MGRELQVRRSALWLAAGWAAASLAAPTAAEARGFIGFSFGFPLVIGPPPVAYPPPAYYYPPPPLPQVAPPPAYAYPPAYAPAPPRRTCREYQTTTIIDGRPQPTYGTACLQPDGSWRIVQ